jgi:hypothetical protein
MCVFAHIYTYMHTYKHACMLSIGQAGDTLSEMDVEILTKTYIYIYIYIYTDTHKYTYIHTYIHTHKYIHTHAYALYNRQVTEVGVQNLTICAYMQTHVHAYIYM